MMEGAVAAKQLLGLMLVGAVWGVTNPFIKRGSVLAAARRANASPVVPSKTALTLLQRVATFWASLLEDWQYVLPFAINLGGSLLFFVTLPNAELSLAVPVANATTFAFTAVVGYLLGEKLDLVHTIPGLALYVLPFAINLGGSLLFFVTLPNAELSLAVPVANATTFAFTAVVGYLLGEKLDLVHTIPGLALVLFGIYLLPGGKSTCLLAFNWQAATVALDACP
eukprot:jgi/Mesen1/3086/ME000184S02152